MKKHLKNIIAFLVTVFFTILVFKSVDIKQTFEAFKLFRTEYIVPLMVIFLLIMIVRTKRWDILLKNKSVKFGSIFEVYMISNLLNIFLPARAGDVFRSCYFGSKYDISKLQVLGSVAAERILDGLSVVFILLLGMMFYGHSPFITKLAISSSLIFVLSFIFVIWIYKNNKCDYICSYVKSWANTLGSKIGKILYELTDKIQPLLNSFIKGFEPLAEPKVLFKVITLSLFSWLFDCILLYCLILIFGIKASFIISFFIVSFSALSTIIPSSSIYVGLYQYAFILAFNLFGIDNSIALSFSLVQQGIVLLTYAFVILYLFIKDRKNLLEIRKETDLNG